MTTLSVYPGRKSLWLSQREAITITALSLFAIYLFVLANLLFLQFHFHWAFIHINISRNASSETLMSMTNVVPLYKILYYLSGREAYSIGVTNVAGNILMFVPMGFALPYFFAGLQNAKRLVATAAFISLAVEFLQLVTATGVFDIDDVLLNTAGTFTGLWFFGMIQNRWSQNQLAATDGLSAVSGQQKQWSVAFPA